MCEGDELICEGDELICEGDELQMCVRVMSCRCV